MNEQAFYRVSVKGVAFDAEGRLLLAREDNDIWEMLGGGLDHGEDPRACLVREIQEETGIKVLNVSENPIGFVTVPKANGSHQIANVIYEVILDNLDFVPSDECQELRYFSLDEAAKINAFPNVTKFLGILASRQ
ncbi:MAG TPA: NUDIX hydrolase [Candidatus Saccharimonadales bacterium]|jgi:8-oxo-dGTP pyrophosphatase MutT (NUDIX family)